MSGSTTRTFDCEADATEAVKLQRLGRHDPTMCFEDDGVWRATHTPEGPATLRVAPDGPRITAEAWGPGAQWVLDRAPAFCGATDHALDFAPQPAWLAELWRRHAHVRLGRALRLFDVAASYVLQQRVRFPDAAASWRRVVARAGETAPGPRELMLPPTPEQWRSISPAELAACDIDPQRIRCLKSTALHARKLEALMDRPLDEARALLPKLPGFGPWTTNMVLAVGLADADAVLVGDAHIPDLVAWALAKEPRATDERMLELLEPHRPHRYRVTRLLYAAGYRNVRFGPRLRRSQRLGR